MLKLKLQYFGHMRGRTDSFEKTLIMGKIEGGRRRGQQGMRWLDGITNMMEVSLSKPGEFGDEQGGLRCCSPWGLKESDSTEWLNWTEPNAYLRKKRWLSFCGALHFDFTSSQVIFQAGLILTGLESQIIETDECCPSNDMSLLISVAQLSPTFWDPMNRSTPGLPVHHQLLEVTQTHVRWVSGAIQPSHPLLSPSPPALNLSQHQGLFQWVSSWHQVAKVLEFQLQHQSFQLTPRTDLL